MMLARRSRVPVVGTIVAALAAAPFGVGTALWARTAIGPSAQTFDRLWPFLATLPKSLLIALGVSAATLLLALRLSPGLCDGRPSPGARLAALAVAIFIPPILLVLVGAVALSMGGLWQPWLPLALQVFAAYPAVALLMALMMERDLLAIAHIGLMRRGARAGSTLLGLRLLPIRATGLLLLGAGVAFQGYLINLLVRQSPQDDALVALSALFPHTGVIWSVGLGAALALWTCYLLLAAAVAGRLLPRSHRKSSA